MASQVGNGCDFALNVILVLFCGLGVMGAALSTLIGVMVTSTLEIYFIFGKNSHLRFLPLKPRFKDVFSSYKTGFAPVYPISIPSSLYGSATMPSTDWPARSVWPSSKWFRACPT